jgi:Lon protease-like protein
MFPLQAVLLPGMVLPLHVFEPRYRALMDDCLAGDREFGVALIERGSEVGGDDVRAGVGVVARIVQADQAPDGRWGVLAVGTRRVQVECWLDDDPYPRAEVADWPDASTVDPVALTAGYGERVRQVRRLLALLSELGQPAQPLAEVSDDPDVGLWQLALLAPLGALDRYRLLATDGAEARLALLVDLLDDLEAEIEARLAAG